jgi:hypothetical protein
MAAVVIPESFVQWAYVQRGELIRRQAEGEKVPSHEIFLGFSRHNPAIVSSGSGGLNASIKGVGFVPKQEHLQDTIDAYLAHINKGWRDGYSAEGLQLLMKHAYGVGCRDCIDFTMFSSLELAKKHSWANLTANPQVTLLFYEPPMISFEVRGRAEIFESGLYHTLVNAQHDVYHKPNPARWADRPAYIFHIEEIWDNSASREGFGTQIM